MPLFIIIVVVVVSFVFLMEGLTDHDIQKSYPKTAIASIIFLSLFTWTVSVSVFYPTTYYKVEEHEVHVWDDMPYIKNEDGTPNFIGRKFNHNLHEGDVVYMKYPNSMYGGIYFPMEKYEITLER